MADPGRRQFLKIASLTCTTAAMGCSRESARRLIPYIIPPEDIIPGEATWYATTCRECPAGCGLLAKNRDGRVIKVEGNPLHPVNDGKLCARGQASVQGLYNPDRVRRPYQKTSRGSLEATSWDLAEDILIQNLSQLIEQGRGERIVFLADLNTGTLRDLIGRWLLEMGSKEFVMYEPFAYEPLRMANQIVFGRDGIPTYRIEKSDFLISFGAGILETWLSNVEYARQFASFHAADNGANNPFVYVGPRLSLTAANADQWIAVPPGREYLVALGMLRVIIDENLLTSRGQDQRHAVKSVVEPFTLEKIVSWSGVEEQTIRSLARRFVQAKRPTAVAEGLSGCVPNATETAVAANLLCSVKSGTAETIDFQRKLSLSDVAPVGSIKDLSQKMRNGEIDLLLIYNANPLFSLPAAWEFHRSLEAVPLVVSFSSCLDETSRFANLIVPVHSPLESWGDYAPNGDVTGLMQPVMGSVLETKHLGDILISTGKQVRGTEKFPWKDFYHLLRDRWYKKWQERATHRSFESFWMDALQKGGAWGYGDTKGPQLSLNSPVDFSFPKLDSQTEPTEGFDFTGYPTVQFFDGRAANRPWIQELPDPITQVTWGGWVEIHPGTAKALGIRKGDLLRLKSPYGTIEVSALPIPSVPPNTVAMPIGQGHTGYGRFASGHPANPIDLLPPDLDTLSGGILRPPFRVTIEHRGQRHAIAHTDGSFYQQGRGFAQATSLEDYRRERKEGRKPHLDVPLREGYNRRKDFYPPHSHPDYRWTMVVDLDRCIGCGACVVSCYAENNVAVVGRELVLKGREMSWLRVQRYFEIDGPPVRFLPMLCQHCDEAPCEPVCPVFAPHHSAEGLNNQVYNRCVGTRFCSQNDPYKVRRFNWFTFTRPEPLNWQLNPDVTVRQKGVMEKCSFCVQRIVEAKNKAKNEGRKVRDGEFTTACAQTCPTNALVFGNLKDSGSRVSKMIGDPRAYQVLGHLNTKPAVIYLKKVTKRLTLV
ncbi:MAG: 4Fe-4S dicluster domain-containing protein [Proteobacteria bacterium]|nr:4Fe-4S dicluster domain-containing protein [Pseudomonadota bacterium]